MKNGKKFSISKDNVRLFGKDIPLPGKPTLDSRTLAAAAATSEVLAIAADFVPPIRALRHVFKGASAVAIGAADAKRISEQDEAAVNRKEHGDKIRTSVKGGKLRGRPVQNLAERDYVQLSFLEDEAIDKLAVAAQVEIMKTQIYLGLDHARNRGMTVPKDLKTFEPGSSGKLQNTTGLATLKKERELIRNLVSGNVAPPNESDGSKEIKGLVRIGALETFNMILKKSGKYGHHLSKAFAVAEAAQVLRELTRLIYYPQDKTFESPEKYVDYLVDRLEKSKKDSQPDQSRLLGYLPRLPGLGK